MKRRMLIPLILLVTIFLILGFINIFGVIVSVLTLIFVDLFLYYRKEIDLKKDFEEESEKEKLEEEKRKKKFPEKFPKISRIPVLNWVTKWMYKEGWYSVVLVLLLVIGFILRIYKLSTLSLWSDEAFSVFSSQSIVNTGIPKLPSGLLYLRSLLFSYILSLFFLLFGVNEFTSRMPSVIFGVFTIPVLYLLGKEMFSKKTGLLSSAVFSLSVFSICWAKQCRMYSQLTFFYIFTVYFLHMYFKTKNQKYKIGLILFTIGTIFTHSLSYTLIPLFVLYSFIYKEKRSFNLKNVKLFFTIIICFVIQYLILYSLNTSATEMVGRTSFFVLGFNLNLYYIDFLKKFLFILYIFVLMTFLYLALSSLINLKNYSTFNLPSTIKNLVICFTLLFLPMLPLTFASTIKSPRYILFVFPFFLIIGCEFLVYATNLLTKKLFKLTRYKKVSILFILIFLSFIVSPYNIYLHLTNPEEFADDLGIETSDYREAADFIKKNMQSDDVIISTCPSPIQYYTGKDVYFLRTHGPITTIKDTNIYSKTGMPILRDISDVERILNSKKNLWIVLDHHFFNSDYYVDKKTKNLIIKNTSFIYKTSDGTIEIRFKKQK